ncbi:hypothetical protein [Salinicoccus bachuensis]|uniref:Tetratricopeptide repeat protein n=1 Tax=Salinicoccus bachuensis TaxID=3136731 RepID=A0ABZ3CKM0_9STAP
MMKYPYAAASHAALKAGMYERARELFKKGLTHRLGADEPVIRIYLRFSQHAYLHSQLDLLDLKEEYRSYLRSLVYRHEKNYQAAWEMIEWIPDEALIPLKVGLLCDMRKKDELIELSDEGVDILAHLKIERKEALIRHMIRNHDTERAEQMISRTEPDKERLRTLFETESSHPVIRYDWETFRNAHLGMKSDPQPEDFSSLMSTIESLEATLQDAAHVHLINRFHDESQYHRMLNRTSVAHMNNKADLLQYISIEALYTLNFNASLLGTPSSQLDLLFEYYHSGNRGQAVIRAIHQLLPEAKLTDSHIRSMRKMILYGTLDLYNERLIQMFREDKKAYTVFQYPALFLNTRINRAVDNFVYFHFSSKVREKIFRPLVNELVESTEKTTLPRYFVHYLERTRHRNFSSMCILVRHTYRSGDKAQVEKYIRELIPDNQFKIRLYLAKFLYGFGELEEALEEVKAAEKLTDQHSELYMSFIKIYRRLGDSENLLKYMGKMREHYPKALPDREYEKAKAAYERLNRN